VTEELVRALDEAHEAFVEALADVDADLVTVPGVMGEWSVRDLVVHVAAWAEHASAALDLAVAGRGAEFAYSTDETDAMNERILADGRATRPAEALARGERAFAGLRARVDALDEPLLGMRLGNGDTVEEVIRYDGPDHYAEHTAHLSAWFGRDEGWDEDE
jgi:hypothetical protein